MRQGAPVGAYQSFTVGPDEYIQQGNKVRWVCRHQQAEPVTLSTGETVACVCIRCFEGLPADYIERQRRDAERIAYCTHDDAVEITILGQVGHTAICTGCGEQTTS